MSTAYFASIDLAVWRGITYGMISTYTRGKKQHTSCVYTHTTHLRYRVVAVASVLHLHDYGDLMCRVSIPSGRSRSLPALALGGVSAERTSTVDTGRAGTGAGALIGERCRGSDRTVDRCGGGEFGASRAWGNTMGLVIPGAGGGAQGRAGAGCGETVGIEGVYGFRFEVEYAVAVERWATINFWALGLSSCISQRQ